MMDWNKPIKLDNKTLWLVAYASILIAILEALYAILVAVKRNRYVVVGVVEGGAGIPEAKDAIIDASALHLRDIGTAAANMGGSEA